MVTASTVPLADRLGGLRPRDKAACLATGQSVGSREAVGGPAVFCRWGWRGVEDGGKDILTCQDE